MLPFSADAEKLQAYMEEHKEEFRNVTEETCELLLTFFDDRDMKLLEERERFHNQEGGGYDMCTAFRQMKEEGIQIGEERGIQIGEERGIQIGVARGEERVNRLFKYLLRDSREKDMQKAISDRAYQKQLFKEYNI